MGFSDRESNAHGSVASRRSHRRIEKHVVAARLRSRWSGVALGRTADAPGPVNVTRRAQLHLTDGVGLEVAHERQTDCTATHSTDCQSKPSLLRILFNFYLSFLSFLFLFSSQHLILVFTAVLNLDNIVIAPVFFM